MEWRCAVRPDYERLDELSHNPHLKECGEVFAKEWPFIRADIRRLEQALERIALIIGNGTCPKTADCPCWEGKDE